jgi:hypothetical protein
MHCVTSWQGICSLKGDLAQAYDCQVGCEIFVQGHAVLIIGARVTRADEDVLQANVQRVGTRHHWPPAELNL